MRAGVVTGSSPTRITEARDRVLSLALLWREARTTKAPIDGIEGALYAAIVRYERECSAVEFSL